MSKQRKWRAVVTGFGSFPFDMLRYDQAHPETESDSAQIQNTHELRRRQDVAPDDYPKVTIIGELPGGPTHGRWQSFMWRVESWEWLP